MGHSAGAHLAMMTAYTHNNEHKIKACVSWAGPLNFIDTTQLSIPASHLVFKKYTGADIAGSLDSLAWKESSPYWVVSPDCPATLLIYGTNDIGVPFCNAQDFKNKLDKFKVINSLLIMSGKGHIFFGATLDKAIEESFNWCKKYLFD